jgi:hypothetical protein
MGFLTPTFLQALQGKRPEFFKMIDRGNVRFHDESPREVPGNVAKTIESSGAGFFGKLLKQNPGLLGRLRTGATSDAKKRKSVLGA